MAYEGEDRRVESWHVKKEVTWGHIMSTVALAAAAIMAWNNMTTQIAILEVKQEATVTAQKERDEKQDSQLQQSEQRTEKKLEKIDENVQKILDHMIKKK